MPDFPEFKPIEIKDRDRIQEMFRAYQPETSELNFTNTFIWRDHYHIQWSLLDGFLIVACEAAAGSCFVMPPIGPGARVGVTQTILNWLSETRHVPAPALERADQRLVDELASSGKFVIEPTPEHFDYLYRTENLIKLSGNRYHAKKNHINKFRKTYQWSYAPLTSASVPACLEVSDLWCRDRRCHEDLDLMDEQTAVRLILANFDALKIFGGLILVDGKVEAFALGEMLNPETAVIHIEKANPDIPQAFVVINQQFCENQWASVPFINREQDLGEDGLRQAKKSYHPERMVPKYRIKLA